VFALQRIMGHADLDMTRRYLALEMRDLEAAHAQASPIQRLLPAPKTRAGRIKK
jgi:site-specific recombinase XerD